jgi:hypothetical protein
MKLEAGFYVQLPHEIFPQILHPRFGGFFMETIRRLFILFTVTVNSQLIKLHSNEQKNFYSSTVQETEVMKVYTVYCE